ncbi:aKG-HExxH-type peptide beta-hydroxylase [Janthinobacterium fluminis]|uniref:HEXXH motif-containing putative peptide modification protein n=1 Tax=Janthinobacterium fluminis TaxID=2987524 RepID=A0ABT5K027_9BURK|nr:HEXXH motif-containing putative peptide modification protein [Janthinobacterium fluminis]MDC8758312.1 HEXXH motif-containing putative peptide modification protein [Janthinobacterium fluminis]
MSGGSRQPSLKGGHAARLVRAAPLDMPHAVFSAAFFIGVTRMKQMVVGSYAPHLYQATGDLDTLATAYHRGVLKRLARQVEQVPKLGGLFALCRSLVMTLMPTTAAAWQPELGATLRKSSTGSTEAAVIHALFALHALRVPASWDFVLTAPLRLSVAGHIFDAAGHISVQAKPDSITIARLDSALEPLTLHWSEAGLRYCGVLPPESPWQYCAPTFLGRKDFEHIYLQSWREPAPDTVPEIIVQWPIPLLAGADAELAGNCAAQVADALDLLAQAGPHYLPWLKPLFRGIATCPLIAPNMRQSGSFSWHSGVFSCGFPLSTEFLSEVFVHEMSHQHYLLISSIVPLTKKDAVEEIYFSTLKGKKRNLDKILLTYHATANMVLFWHDVIVGLGAATPRNVREREVMLRHTHGLAQVLSTVDGLTEAGRAMFHAQGELMNERGYGVKLS